MSFSSPARAGSIASIALLLVTSSRSAGLPEGSAADTPNPPISKTASDSCNVKVKRLEAYAAITEPGKGQATQFSETEINSFLAYELREKYHPCLKSLVVKLDEANLKGVATIDFDVLGMSSKSVLSKFIAKLFAGVHNLTVKGKLLAREGKGSFQLDEAQFDNTTLPNFIVEEIITAVGRKQKPPIDPMQPSQLPYKIDHVDLHQGNILVHQ